MSAATANAETTLIVNGVLGAATNKWYYDTATSAAGLEPLYYGTAITTANWTQMTTNPLAVDMSGSPTHKVARIVEVDSSNYPLAFADIPLNIG